MGRSKKEAGTVITNSPIGEWLLLHNPLRRHQEKREFMINQWRHIGPFNLPAKKWWHLTPSIGSTATPEKRLAREIFAQRLREYRRIEYDGQVELHALRQILGRPLQSSDIPMKMIRNLQPAFDAARQAGRRVLSDRERVDEVLIRASRLEKRKVDQGVGFDTLR